ncbi:methyltransferase domain-containing protein [Brevibacillus ruminantium]|uniref:Methyltransferase domain-containing protein n=1 Tax=Brevibacillus ruminantium TaxID=2950604 RepID=A0ABY4WK79_9BACL|nr:class I SAM-dependent methyltransferase [Brevibacillus ruminantium]USG67492.1 methyltransferase domain-containing protein [Brevibacillus ruminantium]
MSDKNPWNSQLYDRKMSFVSILGKGILDLLDAKPGERILDVGCGTGDLSQEIAIAGALPMGIDFSEEMISAARQKYPHLPFSVADAHDFRTSESFDAVFSNAALHWMKQPEKVAESIWLALRPGGRFVAEFGGAGNVAQVIMALKRVLAAIGVDAEERMPWYFPSIGSYTALLEQHGFTVTFAQLFDRPTPLPDGEGGIAHWLNAFCAPFFVSMQDHEKAEVYREIATQLRPYLYQNGTWVIDYKRIRVAAIKPANP